MLFGRLAFALSDSGLGVAEGEHLKNVRSNIAQKLIEVHQLIYFRQLPFWAVFYLCVVFFALLKSYFYKHCPYYDDPKYRETLKFW